MESTNHILGLLYDRQTGFFSLEELARASRLSRDRLRRRLDVLARAGVEFEFSPAEGVRLARPVRLIGHLIERELGTRRIGRSVVCFGEVDSTNDVAFDAARDRQTDGLVVLADSQRKGRGRHGRKWLDEPGQNILCSVLLLNDGGVLAHEPLTIAAGLATAEAIEAACGLQAELKWPNDVLVDGEKVAGVLIEVRGGRSRAVVLGVGINANSAPARDEVDQPATCLAEHLGHPVERVEVVRALLGRLDVWVDAVGRGGLGELHDAWVARCGMINQRIAVASGGRKFVGRVLDVSPLEGIILAGDDGRRVHLPAAGSEVLAWRNVEEF